MEARRIYGVFFILLTVCFVGLMIYYRENEGAMALICIVMGAVCICARALDEELDE
ncbi:MAG: hypothetical protein LBU27_09415 [Candidatus Peribacteria bacterium]|jgi:hypothetical protein|nr:hypothetical protein [Candidatus Peribacteria bacterium]